MTPLLGLNQNESIVLKYRFVAGNDVTNLEAKKQNINNSIYSEK